jgi:hypothetical protein
MTFVSGWQLGHPVPNVRSAIGRRLPVKAGPVPPPIFGFGRFVQVGHRAILDGRVLGVDGFQPPPWLAHDPNHPGLP